MPTAELSSVLLERALDTYDDLASRHARRVAHGPPDPSLVSARRSLLITRARCEDWLVPVATVVTVERLMAELDAVETIEDEVAELDRFCLDVLDAVERRSTGRRDRDREAETIGFSFS
jgi:hypothetical protein